TTVEPSGTSCIITAPAPTVHHLPILMPCMTHAPMPTCVPSPIETFPASAALGEMWTKSPMEHSWSTEQQVLIITCLPIVTPTLMVAPAITAVPTPMVAYCDTFAEGCTAVVNSKLSGMLAATFFLISF